SPNPNNGNFTIKVAGFNESASATLTDFSGNEIQTYKLHNGDNKIEKEGLQSGTYFVVLRVDGKQEARQIIIK
ncbi:T9SS type A sorting domain-containing protein, partial [Flavobacterium sp.]